MKSKAKKKSKVKSYSDKPYSDKPSLDTCSICGYLYLNKNPKKIGKGICNPCDTKENLGAAIRPIKLASKKKPKKVSNYVKTVSCVECGKKIELGEFLTFQTFCETCFFVEYPDDEPYPGYKVGKSSPIYKPKKEKKKMIAFGNTLISEAQRLPDQGYYTERTYIKSDTSENNYIVARNNNLNRWECDCPGWKRYRKCKHLIKLGFALAKPNSFAKGYDQNPNIPRIGELKTIPMDSSGSMKSKYSTPSSTSSEPEFGVGSKKRKISID